jgi:23S rRNA (guanosine2251-2'-O)-methyltransferase
MAKRKDLIKGIHAVEEAINSGHSINKVMIQKGVRNPSIMAIITRLKQLDIHFQFVPKEKLNRLSSVGHQGIIAISSPIEFVDIDMLIPQLYEQKKSPLICVLDGVTDVRNTGAIARSAFFLEVDALVVPAKGSAEINEEAIKTSAGALLKLPVCRVADLQQTLIFLQNSGLQILSASEKANQLPNTADFTLPTCIVVGAEDKGISPGILKLSNKLLKIPGSQLDSLNVSVSASILFYEAKMQRLKA